MRSVQNIKGWVTALAVIGTVSAVIPVMGAQASQQRDAVQWSEAAAAFQAAFASNIGVGRQTARRNTNASPKRFITKRGLNHALANLPLQML